MFTYHNQDAWEEYLNSNNDKALLIELEYGKCGDLAEAVRTVNDYLKTIGHKS